MHRPPKEIKGEKERRISEVTGRNSAILCYRGERGRGRRIN
jgi:hypothetical protein